MQLAPGVRLGPYQIVSPIGAGGMGEVYRAVDTRLGRDVAVKILNPDLVGTPEAMKRFENEARAVAALSHPNILAIYEFDVEGNMPIVVTELLEGSTLRRRLDSRMPWRKAVDIAAAVADGLAAAHARGIIHRDLKPENIFITAEGHVKILDFGIAHVMNASFAEGSTPSAKTAVFESHSAVGTIGYVSPEQLKGQPPAPTSDIFALGVMLYEMICGKHPFRAETTAETIAAVLHEDPPPLVQTDNRIPIAIDRIIRRCMEKNQGERFQSARDLAYQMREVAREAETPTMPPAIPRRKWIGTAVALGVAVAIAAAVLFVAIDAKRRSSDPITSLAILPLVNATHDPNLDYVSDGITDDLINQLSMLPNVQVTARPTAFRYKSKDIDPARVGQELAVRALATGRIDVQGKRLIIQADLIETANGRQLWGNRYERSRDDITTLPNEIARQIAEKLRVELTSVEKSRLARAPTVNPIAYDLYLKGLHALNLNTPAGRAEAITYFQHAVENDPVFARAWAALAESYTRYSLYTEPRLMRSKGREALNRALELDPNLPEAHVAAGWLRLWDEWNIAGAGNELRRAIQLNPNLADAHEYLAYVLQTDGKFDDAVREAKTAKRLDPLARGSAIAVSSSLLYAGRIDEANAELARLCDVDSSYPAGHYLLARVYEMKGKEREACAEYIKSRELAGTESKFLEAMRQGCKTSGLAGYERALLQYLLTKDIATNAYEIAGVYLDLDDKEKMYEYLEKAFADRNTGMLLLKSDPAFKDVRQEPRFQALMARVGLTRPAPQHQ